MQHASVSFFLTALLSWYSIPCSAQQQTPQTDRDKVAVEDVIPLTMGNLRGHAMLYNEGWFVVTSSKKAFAFAEAKALRSSKEAIRDVVAKTSQNTKEYLHEITADVRDSEQTGKKVVAGGTKRTGEIIATTHARGKAELAFAKASFQKAADVFVQGNLSIAKRTEADRQELASVPGDYFRNLNSDCSNLIDLTNRVRERFSGRIEPQWEKSFQKASREFQAEYEESGKKHNSLAALGPILYGYLKSFYHGLAAPASKTIVKTTIAGTTYVVFLPVSATSVVAGRTVQSVGLTVFYAGTTGVKILSPTIEGGLLSGLSLLSLTAAPLTYTAGGTLGALNQVAFAVAGPAAGTAQGVAETGLHTASYVGFLTYDAAVGTTKVVINQAASGVVLGYNALTALPTHTLLGVTDAAIFLAWDGPRLVIARAQGRIKPAKQADPAESASLGDLPVGTVVDLRKLEQAEGVKVEILSSDPAVIKDVLEKIPDDARAVDEMVK